MMRLWYTTNDGKPIDLNNAQIDWGYPETDYGVNVISNTYSNGKGVIKFDGTVTKVGSWAFWRCMSLEKMYLPKKLNYIGDYAYKNCVNLKTLYLPNQINAVGTRIFDNCLSLESFKSDLASEDGKTLIVNSAIVGFAPFNVAEYTTPIGVTSISDGAFCNAYMLKKIVISEGVKDIGDEAFKAQDPNRYSFSLEYNLSATIEEIYLPSTLEKISTYSFLFQNKITGIYGKRKFVSRR